MQASLRTRLTAWYAVLLGLALALFSTALLWLHWRMLIEHIDDAIDSLADTANNVVDEELAELHDLRRAASEMSAVVRPANYVIQVLDASGAPLYPTDRAIPLSPELRQPDPRPLHHTVSDASGRPWRVTARASRSPGYRYVVIVGGPVDDARRAWAALLRACLIGTPLAVVCAVGGGLVLGRRGLGPLTTMAADAQAITAQTLDSRLTVPRNAVELEQLATSFNRVLDRLADALSTQRRFMADASHELRTPLSIVRTAADVTLSQPTRVEAEYRDALGTVSHQSSRLTRLVDDMLVLARADGGGYPIAFDRVDLAALVRDCVRDLQPLAQARSITVRTTLAAATVLGDDALLRRMCSNLVTNAVTYTPRGGLVAVSVEKNGDRVLVRVVDSGPGIPLQDQDRVFERFVRLDPARAAGGSGLGLAISRWVAQAHGGTLTIVASSPQGSTFAAALPFEVLPRS